MTDQTAPEQKPTPDASLFQVNEKPREYDVTFRIKGTVRRTIKADSLEEAQSIARAMAEDENDDFSDDLDEVDDVDVRHVVKTAKMYLVTRNGKKLQTSHLQPGDQPREPDERGF